MGLPWPLFHYFCVFKQIIQILQKIVREKCPSSIWGWDLNSDYESPLLTTRPGLSPKKCHVIIWIFIEDKG